MVLTFPHMGNIYIPLKALFDDMGVKTAVPPFCSKKTLDIGTRLSPDSICMPLKINLGNYIESIPEGADTFVLTGSCGPCRFGYYGVCEKEILADNGFAADIVVLDPSCGVPVLMERLAKISGGTNIFNGAWALRNALRLCEKVDALEKKVFGLRAREINKGDADRIYSQFKKDVLGLTGSAQIMALTESVSKALDAIPADNKATPLRIGIIGEIYTIIEPYTNLNIEKKLGEMGILADRSLTASGWIKDKLFHRAFGGYADRDIYATARPYLDRCIGGHTQECIGHAIRYASLGYDGAIEVLPFGCMPEIVSKSILPQVSRDYNFPILTLVVDELTGESGFNTRLEAFLDLLSYNRSRRLS